jgi:hypothetical protein
VRATWEFSEHESRRKQPTEFRSRNSGAVAQSDAALNLTYSGSAK